MAGRGVDIKLGGSSATEEEYQEIKNLGGLYVIGTERHEARRTDNQLRGRAGRQGDPGETQFFLSLEDSLMRVFGPDRIKGMMGRFGIPEDEPIQNRMISKAIESAQSKIEGLNFDARRHVLEYDNVVNTQRMSIYGKRRTVLLGSEDEVVDFLKNGIENEDFYKKFKEKEETFGSPVWFANVRKAILQIVDLLWVEHLETIDYVKNSVRLRAYGQRDPLIEFKKEGRRLFEELEYRIYEEVEKIIPNIGDGVKTEQRTLSEVHNQASAILREGAVSDNKTQKPNNSNGGFPKVGRNDPCPCGSGKKYKKCHGLS